MIELFYEDSILKLKLIKKVKFKPIFVDFTSAEFLDKKRHKINKSHILYKALGLKGGKKQILDGTAGFATDAWRLVMAGHSVIALEKNPNVFKLVADAWERGMRCPQISALLQSNFKILQIDTLEYIKTENLSMIDVVYLDPMFPMKKHGLSPKPMQVLQDILPAENPEAFVQEVIAAKIARVVVKRPKSYKNTQLKPTHSFVGKSIRYDVYINSL